MPASFGYLDTFSKECVDCRSIDVTIEDPGQPGPGPDIDDHFKDWRQERSSPPGRLETTRKRECSRLSLNPAPRSSTMKRKRFRFKSDSLHLCRDPKIDILTLIMRGEADNCPPSSNLYTKKLANWTQKCRQTIQMWGEK